MSSLPTIVICRHGQTVVNDLKPRKYFADDVQRDTLLARLGGAYDDLRVPLNPKGISQAKGSARQFQSKFGRLPDAIVSSNADRAVMTAAMQIEEFGQPVPLRIDARLRERNFSDLEMMTEQEIAGTYTTFQRDRDEQGGFYHRPPGGESLSDLASGRLKEAVDDLKRTAIEKGQLVLVDTHLNAMRVIMMLMLGRDPEWLRRDWEVKIENGELITFVYSDGEWVLG